MTLVADTLSSGEVPSDGTPAGQAAALAEAARLSRADQGTASGASRVLDSPASSVVPGVEEALRGLKWYSPTAEPGTPPAPRAGTPGATAQPPDGVEAVAPDDQVWLQPLLGLEDGQGPLAGALDPLHAEEGGRLALTLAAGGLACWVAQESFAPQAYGRPARHRLLR
jgi:hypothetical protein